MTTSSSKNLNKKTLNLNSGANYSGTSQLSLRYISILNIPFRAVLRGQRDGKHFLAGQQRRRDNQHRRDF